jgi:hypothetical protein
LLSLSWQEPQSCTQLESQSPQPTLLTLSSPPPPPFPPPPQHKYIGTEGAFIGIDTFGASAPAPLLYEKFGITLDNVISKAKALF